MTQAPETLPFPEQLRTLKSELKQAKDAKARVAVQFKNAVPGSEEHAALILSMQDVSSNVKFIEQKIKGLERDIEAAKKVLSVKPAVSPPLLTISQENKWNADITIRELTPDEIPGWFAFISTIANATAYHQQSWKDLIESAFQNQTRVWAAFDSNQKILGGIPLVFFNSRLFGKFAVSIPYVNYGGVISRYFDVAQQLMAYLPSVCKTENLSHIEIRTMQSGLASHASSKKVSMILPLPNTSEELDKDLGSKVRAQQKKAEEHNPSITFGKLDLLHDFYTVFSKNMRDLGTPVYSKNWFAVILEDKRVDATLAVVYVKGKPVSAGFLVGHNRMLEIPWASTIKEANILNTNMWMYRKILDFAIKKEFAFFDFGRSTQDAGTYKFKKQWGAIPHPHYWYKILPDANNAAPELNPDNPKFALMIAIWKRLPLWLANLMGPPIIRNIP